MAETSTTALLTTHAKEILKQYIAYDVSSRMEYVYTARLDAVHGERCLVTRYVYDGVSTRIIKRKEYYGTWDSSYDI